MPTVYTTIKAHLHNPEPGSTIAKRLEHSDGSFIILDFTAGEVGTPDVSAFFPTWEHARQWATMVVAAVIEAEATEELTRQVAAEIGATA